MTKNKTRQSKIIVRVRILSSLHNYRLTEHFADGCIDSSDVNVHRVECTVVTGCTAVN